MENDNSLRYPTGKYNPPADITRAQINQWIDQLESLPNKIEQLCQPLSLEQYNSKYRRGSWTIRQVLYHITDSHSNSYIRFKWTLTENTPLIKGYLEKKWAALPDSMYSIPEESIEEIKIIQRRIVRVAKTISDADLNKAFTHPETGKKISLGKLIGMYAWHGNHHLAHINIAINNPVKDYVPIDCNFYDELVLRTMRKTNLSVKAGETIIKQNITIADLITDNKEEFIILSDGTKMRLDNIIDLKDNDLIIHS